MAAMMADASPGGCLRQPDRHGSFFGVPDFHYSHLEPELKPRTTHPLSLVQQVLLDLSFAALAIIASAILVQRYGTLPVADAIMELTKPGRSSCETRPSIVLPML